MAKIVMTDAYVSLGGNDLSAYVKSVTLNYSAETLDATAMGTTGFKANKAGLKDWSAEVEFHQDYADNALDELAFAMVGTEVACIFRPVKSTVVGAANPNYTAQGVVESYTPMGGSVGELAGTSLSIKPGDPGTLTRALT